MFLSLTRVLVSTTFGNSVKTEKFPFKVRKSDVQIYGDGAHYDRDTQYPKVKCGLVQVAGQTYTVVETGEMLEKLMAE